MARCSWALIYSMAVVVVQLVVDVPTAAAAVESSAAARRRLPAAPLPPLRRPSACQRWRGSAAIWRRAALAHATLANACDLQHFSRILDFDGLCKRDSVRTDQG